MNLDIIKQPIGVNYYQEFKSIAEAIYLGRKRSGRKAQIDQMSSKKV